MMTTTSKSVTSDSGNDYADYDMEMAPINTTGLSIIEYAIEIINASATPPIQINNASSNTTFQSTEEKKEKYPCGEWLPAQPKLFQIANILFLCAFFIPNTVKRNWIISRVIMTVSILMSLVWSFMYNCSIDVIIWNIIHSVILSISCLRHVTRIISSTFSADIKVLYDQQFKIFNIDRYQFKGFINLGKQTFLNEGFVYAAERETPITHEFSLLLKGRMVVSILNKEMYTISPNTFIDSLDWEINLEMHNPTGTYQATIIAEEPCHIITWNINDVKKFLNRHSRLRYMLYFIYGLDISQKLNALDALYNPSGFDRHTQLRNTIEAYRRLVRSFSADAVNTSYGTMRSQSWFDEEKRKQEEMEQGNQQNKAPFHDYLKSLLVNKQTEKFDTDTMAANQFPAHSPFSLPDNLNSPPEHHLPVAPLAFEITEEGEDHLLLPRSRSLKKKKASVRRHGTKEVKFETPPLENTCETSFISPSDRFSGVSLKNSYH